MIEKTIYTAADIQRYINGEMTPADMNALEKAALEDPFLQDALEGYFDKKSLEPVAIDHDLQQLQGRLASRLQENKKVVPLYKIQGLRTAALILLVAGAGILVYNFFDGKSTTKMEMATKQMEVRTETLADTLNTAPTPLPDSSSLALKETYPEERSTSRSRREEPPTLAPEISRPKQQPAPGERSIQSAPSPAADENDALKNINTEKEMMAKSVGSGAKPSARLSKESDIAPGKETTFRAQVLTADSMPLPGALVVAGSDKEKTVVATNVTGHVNTVLQDSVVVVSVFAAGYQPYINKIGNNGNGHMIVMKQDAALRNNRVGATKMSAFISPPKISFVARQADPAAGWTAYYKYLDNSSGPLQTTTNYDTLKVSFEINGNGQLQNFQTTVPLSEPISQQVIRLIRQGPAWKTPGKNKGFVIATFVF